MDGGRPTGLGYQRVRRPSVPRLVHPRTDAHSISHLTVFAAVSVIGISPYATETRCTGSAVAYGDVNDRHYTVHSRSQRTYAARVYCAEAYSPPTLLRHRIRRHRRICAPDACNDVCVSAEGIDGPSAYGQLYVATMHTAPAAIWMNKRVRVLKVFVSSLELV